MVPPNRSGKIPISRLLLLFVLFLLICCGLGYPSLNRVDWRKAPGGLEDVLTYAALVTAPPVADPNDHTQFRVLVPYLAKPIYRVALNHIGTWDPIMFALLIVNAFFVAATALVLVMVVSRQIGSYSIALGSALIYLLNFAVPNLRLVGMIDAGEACFLMLLVWSLSEDRYWTLPVWGILGSMAKESFVPFLVVFTLTWWVCSWKTLRKPALAAVWMIVSWSAALASMMTVQRRILGAYQSPIRFGLGLHHNTAYISHFVGSLADRNLWYIFIWLLPLSLLRLKRMPRAWLISTAAASFTAFAMNSFYGGPPGAIGRALFSVAGPLLSASVAIFLFTGVGMHSQNDAGGRIESAVQ